MLVDTLAIFVIPNAPHVVEDKVIIAYLVVQVFISILHPIHALFHVIQTNMLLDIHVITVILPVLHVLQD